jgi:hypothetical protein
MNEPDSYAEFWDFYVSEHSKPITRRLHFAGTGLGIVMLVWLIGRGTWYYFPVCLAVGYAFAWFAHFAVEKNRPASFRYPIWSFISDYKMMYFMMWGKMDAEVERVRSERSGDNTL